MKFDNIPNLVWNALVNSEKSQCILVVWNRKSCSFCWFTLGITIFELLFIRYNFCQNRCLLYIDNLHYLHRSTDGHRLASIPHHVLTHGSICHSVLINWKQFVFFLGWTSCVFICVLFSIHAWICLNLIIFIKIFNNGYA